MFIKLESAVNYVHRSIQHISLRSCQHEQCKDKCDYMPKEHEIDSYGNPIRHAIKSQLHNGTGVMVLKRDKYTSFRNAIQYFIGLSSEQMEAILSSMTSTELIFVAITDKECLVSFEQLSDAVTIATDESITLWDQRIHIMANFHILTHEEILVRRTYEKPNKQRVNELLNLQADQFDKTFRFNNLYYARTRAYKRRLQHQFVETTGDNYWMAKLRTDDDEADVGEDQVDAYSVQGPVYVQTTEEEEMERV